eukprot:31347-Pelagococcus_subviridis.AAC.7
MYLLGTYYEGTKVHINIAILYLGIFEGTPSIFVYHFYSANPTRSEHDTLTTGTTCPLRGCRRRRRAESTPAWRALNEQTSSTM